MPSKTFHGLDSEAILIESMGDFVCVDLEPVGGETALANFSPAAARRIAKAFKRAAKEAERRG